MTCIFLKYEKFLFSFFKVLVISSDFTQCMPHGVKETDLNQQQAKPKECCITCCLEEKQQEYGPVIQVKK